jgi:hypothetical protein
MAPTRQRDLVEGAEAFRLLMIERGPFSPSIDRPGSETTGQCAFRRRAQATEAPPATSAQHPEEIENNQERPSRRDKLRGCPVVVIEPAHGATATLSLMHGILGDFLGCVTSREIPFGMPTAMYRAPPAEQLATLRERAAQFRLLAMNVPRSQQIIAERLIEAAADLEAKARELEHGEYA